MLKLIFAVSALASPVSALTFQATFSADGLLTAPDGFEAGFRDRSFNFIADQIENIDIDGQILTNSLGDARINYSISTDGLGQISDIQYQYTEDFSEEYIDIGLTSVTWVFVDDNTYVGTGSWTVSEVPIPATLPLLVVALGGLVITRRHRQQ